jgi:ABC-type transporter Mla subunit MlaD
MIDPAFFQAARRRIEAVATCEDLQDAAEVASGLAELQADIAERMAQIAPIVALLQAPDANLVKIVTWISDFIAASLAPQIRPLQKYALQLATISAEAGAIAAAIEAKAATIGDCHVSLPGIGL